MACCPVAHKTALDNVGGSEFRQVRLLDELAHARAAACGQLSEVRRHSP